MHDKWVFEACPVVSSLSVLSPEVTHQSRKLGQGCEHVHDPENVDILREIGCFLQSNLKMFCYLLKLCSREPETAYFLNCFKSYLPFCLIINIVQFNNLSNRISSGNWPTQRHQNGVTDLQVFYSRSCMDRKMSRPMKTLWSIEQIVLWYHFGMTLAVSLVLFQVKLTQIRLG